MGILELFKRKEPVEREIDYEGFKLVYSEGTSIVDRFLRDGAYEEEFVDELATTIQSKGPGATFLDIGANIGMISLSCLRKCKDLSIIAFEPGPHQLSLFRKTIARNGLQNKITLSDIALSNKVGTATFRVHDHKDVSGDGFIDTGRAGKTRSIKVKTDTLDNWWLECGKPRVDVIKMDTEGAEYYILEGAKKLISEIRPVIFIEINDKNIRNYPFEIADLLQLIDGLGYKITTLDGQAVDSSNIPTLIRKNDTFKLLNKDVL